MPGRLRGSGMAYTNLGLVAHAKAALELNTVYMWGGILRPVTAHYISHLASRYPSHYSASRQSALRGLVDKGFHGVDCVGLIKSYYWGGVGSPNYKGETDVDANAMYRDASVKGNISTMPELPGLCVWMQGHIGIYVGNGLVIEATNSVHGDGVTVTELQGRGWTGWLRCPTIDYITEEDEDVKKVTVYVGDNKREVDAYLIDGKTYVALREIVEALQPKVTWDEQEGAAAVEL